LLACLATPAHREDCHTTKAKGMPGRNPPEPLPQMSAEKQLTNKRLDVRAGIAS
jgi:hypothetical protein